MKRVVPSTLAFGSPSLLKINAHTLHPDFLWKAAVSAVQGLLAHIPHAKWEESLDTGPRGLH